MDMHRLNLLKKYIIDSQIYVSLMGTLFAVFFMFEQDIIRTPTIALIFITYFSGYLYTKYQDSGKIFYKVLILNVISGLISAALIIYNHNDGRLVKWVIIIIIGLLYDSKFLKYFIRKIPLFKVFYVGLTWALINSWLILPTFHPEIFWISLLFITALVLPFDIRDMKSDTVVTFPRLIGEQNTKYFAYFLVFVSLMIAIFYLKPEYSFAFYLTSIITFILIYLSENGNKDSYFSFWIETCSGMPLLFMLLHWLIN
ncbi:hypothetical protein [Kaistella jeonii]|uniref:Prenyltransferase n=1 Tax=Kaistella jeonii TaxID=266749 RepID=A0A0C1FKH3_9FLAO|nr:hypothetical protein [Kaistella jeonii]KIA88434.1 hypothetical protein OA86_10360 [Kaistella jeonii]SFC16941.1 hypothetical protein SAMN05421876_10832 [Kaistella jeonii]VEI95398.1 prenyltransferase [Kaistella jeonii]